MDTYSFLVGFAAGVAVMSVVAVIAAIALLRKIEPRLPW